MVVMTRTPIRLLLICLIATATGCDQKNGGAGSGNSQNTTNSSVNALGYQTPEALLDHIRSLPPTAESRFTYLKLFHIKTNTDTMVMRFMRNIENARLQYAKALNEVFGAEKPVVPADLDMAAFTEALKSATIEPVDNRHARVAWKNARGESGVVVFIRAEGAWRVSTDTIHDGDRLDDNWVSRQQGRWSGLIKCHRDGAANISARKFATVQEADAALKRCLSGPLPGLGTVHLDE